MVNNCVEKKTTRRSFPPEFKLQVLQSYRYDNDCRGNQRATARKYGIHRRQIQKWIVLEDNLRVIVARAVQERSQSKLLHLPKNIKKEEQFDDDLNNNFEINNNMPMDLSMKKEPILDLSKSSHDNAESSILKSELKQHFDDYDLPRPQPMRPLPIYMNQVPFYYSSYHCCAPYTLNNWIQNQDQPQHQQVPEHHQLYSSPQQSCLMPPSSYSSNSDCYSPIMDYCCDPHAHPYALPYVHQHGSGVNETAAMAIKFGMQVLI